MNLENRKAGTEENGENEGAAKVPLFIPLRREWFEAFENGHKTFEYRPLGPRWNARTCAIGRRVVLSLGYGRQRRLRGTIVSFEQSEDVIRTSAWQSIYGSKGYTMAAKIGVQLDPAPGSPLPASAAAS
jgi:hypothetical protein